MPAFVYTLIGKSYSCQFLQINAHVRCAVFSFRQVDIARAGVDDRHDIARGSLENNSSQGRSAHREQPAARHGIAVHLDGEVAGVAARNSRHKGVGAVRADGDV